MLNSRKSKPEKELKGSVSIGKNSLLEKEIKSFIEAKWKEYDSEFNEFLEHAETM